MPIMLTIEEPHFELFHFLTPETLLKRLEVIDPWFGLPPFEFEFQLFENPSPLLLVWLLKRTWPRERTLYSPAVSFPSTALLPPKNEVRCFRFLLALKAIERLPEVFWNIDPPPLVLDLDDSTLCWRFIGRGNKLLLECELWRDSDEERRIKPQRILLNSSFMLISSSIRRCCENSWLSPYVSSNRCILARFANLFARRSWVLTSSSLASPEFSFKRENGKKRMVPI